MMTLISLNPRELNVAAGQSTLSIADLPFVYSIANILVILYTGTVDINRFYVVGLIAGLIGTFFVIVHPVQLGLDRRWKNVSKFHSKYHITNEGASPPDRDIEMEVINVQRSLKLVGIKYEKDKIVGAIYFLVILVTIFGSLFNVSFQHALGFETPFSSLWYSIQAVFLFMLCLTGAVIIREMLSFTSKLKTCAMYFYLIKRWGRHVEIRPRLDEIKHSIDNNDWDIGKQLLEQEIINLWGNF
jgi:hypothetical protein